jgi:predicted esterase
MFRRVLLILSASVLVVTGCTEDRRPTGPTDAGSDGGGGDGGPMLLPEDVPADAIGGDPASACPSSFATTAPGEGVNSGFESAGQSREFVLFLPPASFAGPRPIFFGFNGTGENGSSFSSRAELGSFADRGFIVVAPSSNMNGTVWPIWDDMRMAGDTRPNADVAYFDDLLACLGAHFEVDANRVYVGGHSAGGIFTNALVQRRSDVIAGAIVASGVFDLTSPPDLSSLSPTFVMVTWGGADDSYSGGVGVSVPEINFVEQASIASQFYEDEASVGQANCSITSGDSGHYWLPINDYFAERLLAHPRGVPGSAADFSVPPSPAPAITCTAEPFVYASGDGLTCPASEPAGCQTACQLLADCGVTNATVGPVVGAQLDMLGFGSVDSPDCGGCVSKCETDAGAGDDEIFTCLEPYISMCGPGISGFLPAADGINACCDGRSDSPWCVEVCRVLLTNDLASDFFPTCLEL